MQRFKAERRLKFDRGQRMVLEYGFVNCHGKFYATNAKKFMSPKLQARVSAIGMIFQRHMWREYAMTFKGRKTSTGMDQSWVESILRETFPGCLRRCRMAHGANFYLSRSRDFGFRLP
jgi:hypothetical protein